MFQALTGPLGAKCGASFINAKFKEWLRQVLGERNYTHLDPLSDSQRINAQAMEIAEMRLLMSRFEAAKKIFCADSDDVELELPAPLHTLNIPGRVDQGLLTISQQVDSVSGLVTLLIPYSDEMQSFFDPCVDDIIELIDGQIAQVGARKNRVKVPQARCDVSHHIVDHASQSFSSAVSASLSSCAKSWINPLTSYEI